MELSIALHQKFIPANIAKESELYIENQTIGTVQMKNYRYTKTLNGA